MNEKETILEELMNMGLDMSDLSELIFEKDTIPKEYSKKDGKCESSVSALKEEGKRYVLVPNLCKKVGYIAQQVPKHNALIIAFFELEECEWGKEVHRFVFYQDEFFERAKNDLSFSVFSPPTENILDMRGDVVSNPTSGMGFNISNRTSKEILGYFGGPVMMGKRNWKDEYIISDAPQDIKYVSTFESGYSIVCFLEQIIELRKKHDDISFKGGIKKLNMEGIDFKETPLPDEIKTRLRQGMYKMVGNCSNRCVGLKKCINVGYLQKCGDSGYVYRIYRVILKGDLNMEKKEAPLRYIELARFGIHRRNEDERFGHMVCPLIGCNEEMAYFKDQAQEAIDQTLAYIGKFANGPDVQDYMNYVGLPISCAEDPFTEKIYNFAKTLGKDSKFFQEIRLKAQDRLDTRWETLGELNHNEKELHKMIQCPKALLTDSELRENYNAWAGCIRRAKFLFGKNMDYYMSMNKDDVKKLTKILLLNSYTATLRELVDIAGPQNIFGYYDFLKELDSDERAVYKNYLDKIQVVKQYVGKIDWRVKGEALEKAEESISPVYNILNDQKAYEDVKKRFQESFDEWKKYEYEDANFIITYPKGPSEIVEEGIKLRHCVKEFIDYQKHGDTMILFVRKKTRMFKPYLTIEIRNGILRQAHGFDNCCISDFPENEYRAIKRLLTNFCESKHIVFDEEKIDELLGV